METTLSRREFGKRATLTAVGLRFAYLAARVGGITAIAVSEVGCNLWSNILNWIPVGEAAVNSIISVLSANGIVISPAIQAAVNLVEAGFTALTAAIKEYQSITPPPVGAIAKVEAAFSSITDNFSTFLKSLSVSSGLISTIIGLAQVIFSTIAAFVNQLPKATALKLATLTSSVTVAGTTAVVVPKMRTVRAFKKAYNAQLDGGVQVGVNVPKTAYLPLTFWEHL